MAFKAGTIYGEAKLDTSDFSRGMGVLQKGLTAAAVIMAAKAIADQFTAAIKVADTYQKSLSNVATVCDTSKVSMSGLSASVLRMNPALGTSTQLMNAMYQTFSSGASSLEEAMEITEQAAMFSKAALTDAEKSVDVLTTAINAYGKDIVNAAKASDIFFQTVKLGKLTGEELAASIGQSIPLFSSAGIKLEELAAGMAAMTQQGITAHHSATQLNSIVNAFLKPSEAMVSLLGELGYESGSAFLKTEGLAGALKVLETATGGDAAELAKLIPELNGMKGAMALTGRGGEIFASSLDAMATAAGSTSEAFDKQRKVFDTAKASWTNLQTVVGNIATYFTDDLVASTGTAAQNIQEFLTSGAGMDFFAESAGFVAGAFSSIVAVSKPFVADIMPGLKEIGASATGVMDNLGKKTGTSVSGFKIFGVAAQYLSAVFRVWSKIASEVIQQLGRTATAAVESGKTIGVFFEFVAGKKKWEDVKKQADETGKAFADLAKGALESTLDIGKEVVDIIKDFGPGVEDKVTKIETAFVTSSTEASNAIRHNWESVWTGAAGVGEAAATDIVDANEEITESTEEETKKASNIWADYWADLWIDSKLTAKGIIATTESLLSEISSMAGNLTDLVFSNEKAVLDNELASIKKAIEEIDTTLDKALDDLESSTSAQMDAIDEDTQRLLESLGIAEETKAESLQRQIEEARAAGDEEAALELENELTREQILADAEARKEAIRVAAKAKEEQLQKEADDRKAALEADQLTKKNALAKKQFDAEKVNDIASVWMDAASATLGWWEQAPALGPIAGPIFGGVMSGLMATFAGVQSGLIAGKQFVPEYADGGTASGLARINEEGEEIVNLPDGTIVIPHDISRDIAAAVGERTQVPNMTISFAGARIDKGVDLEYMAGKISRILASKMKVPA